MIRTLTAASVAALCFAAPALAETRTYDVGAFTGLEVSAGINVNFETGQARSVSVRNAKDNFDDIIVEVKGDTLILKRPRKIGWGKRTRYTVTVSAPSLDRVEASSGADVTGSGLSGDEVSISSSSGADATITGIDAQTVRLESSSGSDIEASGTCDRVIADSSSGADIEAGDLVCRIGDADASSGSDITIHVSESINADVSSGADIDVYGQPEARNTDKSSGGSVNFKG